MSPNETWARLLDRARLELPERTFRTWLEPTSPLEFQNNTLIIGTPDRFAAEWNESKHTAMLEAYGPLVLGHPISVVFRVDAGATDSTSDGFLRRTTTTKILWQ